MDRKTRVDTGDAALENLFWKGGASKESAPKAISVTVMECQCHSASHSSGDGGGDDFKAASGSSSTGGSATG